MNWIKDLIGFIIHLSPKHFFHITVAFGLLYLASEWLDLASFRSVFGAIALVSASFFGTMLVVLAFEWARDKAREIDAQRRSRAKEKKDREKLDYLLGDLPENEYEYLKRIYIREQYLRCCLPVNEAIVQRLEAKGIILRSDPHNALPSNNDNIVSFDIHPVAFEDLSERYEREIAELRKR